MKNNKITRNMMIFIMDNFTVIIQFNMNIYGQLIDNDESLFIRLCFKCKKNKKLLSVETGNKNGCYCWVTVGCDRLSAPSLLGNVEIGRSH